MRQIQYCTYTTNYTPHGICPISTNHIVRLQVHVRLVISITAAITETIRNSTCKRTHIHMQKKQPILHELGPLLTLEVFKLEIIIKTQLFKLSEDAKYSW